MQQFQTLRRLFLFYVLTLLIMLSLYYIALYLQISDTNKQYSVEVYNALEYEIGKYTAPTNTEIDELLKKPYFQNISYQITVIRPSGKTHIHQKLRSDEKAFSSFGFPTSFDDDSNFKLTNHSLMGIVDNTNNYQYYVILRHKTMTNNWLSSQYWLPLIATIILMMLALFYLFKRHNDWEELLLYTDKLSIDAKEAYSPPSFTNRYSTTEFLRLGHALSRVKYQLHNDYRRIKTLQHRLERLVDYAPLPIMMISRQGQISFFNQRFEQIFGVSFQSNIDYTLTDFVSGSDKTTQQLLSNLSTQRVNRTLLVCSLDTQQAYQLHITPWFSEYDQVRGFTGLLSNVNELSTQNDNLKIQNQKLESQVKDFIKLRSVIGHELRTPLNAIIGTLDLIAVDSLSVDQKQILTMLIQSSHSMLTMLNDMLDMAKLGAGRMDIVTESVDIFKLGEHVSELMKGRDQRQGLDLLYCFAPDCPRYITTDNGRLSQVLLNFLDNAVKFTDTGFVALTIEPITQEQMVALANKDRTNSIRARHLKSLSNHTNVETGHELSHRWICFSVKDSGIGIASDEQNKLFSYFNQANPQINQNFGGTGLGLAISNSFALLLDGFIQLDSVSGQGSTFNLYLPCREPLYQPVYHAHPSLNNIHLIAIVKHSLYENYLRRIGAYLSMTVSTYTAVDSHSLQQITKHISTEHQPLSPILLLDAEFYSNTSNLVVDSLQKSPNHFDIKNANLSDDNYSLTDLQLFGDIIENTGVPKILLSRKPERNVSATVLDKFDGFLNQPINITLLLSELVRLVQPTMLDVKLDNITQDQDKLTIDNLEAIKEVDNQIIDTLKPIDSNIKTPTVLVVDDNITNQKITCKLLSKLGYSSIVADNGQQALTLLDAKRQEITLIFMDCRMPVMDGLEATKVIRATGDNIPIIALTANNTDNDRKECFTAGMDDFLEKPIRKEHLLAVLQRFGDR